MRLGQNWVTFSKGQKKFGIVKSKLRRTTRIKEEKRKEKKGPRLK